MTLARVICTNLRLSAVRTLYASQTCRHTQSRRSCQRVTVMAASSDPGYFVLQYSYVPDILDRRGPHREAHLQGARDLLEMGKLVMAGALVEPVDGGLFIFKGHSREDIEEFVKADPYVVNGLVTDWKIRPYAVVVGG